MDEVYIKQLTGNPLTYVVVAWIVREVWAMIKHQEANVEKAIKENSTRMSELTLAIVKLETRFESLSLTVNSVPKMQVDLNVLHEKVRQLRDGSTTKA